MNNEAPQPTNERRMLRINSGERPNMRQWEASTGLSKWGIKSEARNIMTATAPLPLSPFPFHQLTFTRTTTSPSQDQSIQESSIYNIVEKYQPNGHRWALNHLLEGRPPCPRRPSSPGRSSSISTTVDDIFLFRLLESTSALPKSTRTCSRHHSHKHSTVVHDWGAKLDVSTA